MKQSPHHLLLALIRAETPDELRSSIEAAETFLDSEASDPELAAALDRAHYRYFIEGSAAPQGAVATPGMSDAECEAAWDLACGRVTQH